MAKPPVPNPEPSTGQTPAGNLTGLPLIFAVAFIAVWLASLAYLHFFEIGDDDTRWQRAVFLFHSVETVAFAAAGALLGKEVHRANEAEKRATKAEGEADLGKRVAQSVKTEATMISSAPDKKAIWADTGSESLRLANLLLPN